MASINSLSGSGSSSSIYGNRTYNIISGLASGLDTESLISGVVQSYQQKIQSLQQKNTSLQWQQQAIQSISDKLVEFDRNFASYVYSDTNLLSSSFFTNAVKTTANGDFASLVSASGQTNSTVILNAVKQLATASRYAVSSNHLNPNSADGSKVTGSSEVNLAGDMELSNLSGSLSLSYGDREITLDFSDTELFADAEGHLDEAKLQAAIEKKLGEQQISTSSGTMVDADTLVGVTVENGRVSFYDKSSGGNSVAITGATGDLAGAIQDLDSVVDSESGTFAFADTNNVVKKTNIAEYLSGKSITVTLDGKSKTIELPEIDPASETLNKDFIDSLNTELTKAFGSGKVTASFENGDKGGKLVFDVSGGSNLAVTCDDGGVGKALGIGEGMSSYLDTTKTLGSLNIDLSKISGGYDLMAVGKITQLKDANGNPIEGKYVDEEGNAVDAEGYRLGQDGQRLQGYDLVINDVKIGTYTRDTELNTIINNINANTEAGVNVSYSKTTGQFVFTAKETGSGGRVEIGEGLGQALFYTPNESGDGYVAGTYTAGEDAKFIATINGQTQEFTRASNTFDLDGMNVTVSGTFNEDATIDSVKDLAANESVSFTSKTDADTVVEAVKSMVDSLNEIIKAVKSAYSDMPLQQSDGSEYKPLTDEDKADMTESAIEAYEEKAKTGILFMDSDLSSLYNDLRNAITSSGADGVTLRSIGIETAYTDGLTTITLDENKLREALESDPNKVQEAFTKSKENGAATDGLMTTIKSITDRYASTTGDVKGILIEKAGSKYSPTAALDNTMLDQMKDVEEEIAKWQDKMSNQVDYYTNKFTQLELLINQMNSQSSSLAGLLGG